jgi:hypothetical protein
MEDVPGVDTEACRDHQGDADSKEHKASQKAGQAVNKQRWVCKGSHHGSFYLTHHITEIHDTSTYLATLLFP